MGQERFRATWLDTFISLSLITLVVLVVVAAKDLAAEKTNFVPEAKIEFVATLAPEGVLNIRGRLRSELGKSTIESFAKGRFEAAKVNNMARLDPDLPSDWLLRVLAGLDALSQLSTGAVVVSQDQITISGTTNNPDATSNIARIVLRELGENTPLLINVTYDTSIGSVISLSTPEECQLKIIKTLENRGISFEPGSATPSRDAGAVLDNIANVLKVCGEIDIEIAGHTHSQGRAEMNLELSQARAQAVLGELRIRRVLNPYIKAVGYGEAKPIADNNTYEGRRQNERIEIRLAGYQEPKTSVSQETRLQAQAPMSRAEASARYAATGIWQVAPDQPLTPATQAAPDPYIASLDGKVHIGNAITLPNLVEIARDAGLASEPSPGVRSPEFVIDERGLVRAAPGRALTPDGVPVFAGRPSILPPALPSRSATGAGSGTPHIALQRLAPFNPRSRPDNLVELNERSQLGGLTRNELALIRPKLRPEYLMQLRQRHLWPSLTPDELASIKPELLPNKVDPVAVERGYGDKACRTCG